MKLCAACSQTLTKEKFSKKQWQLKEQRRCKECIAGNREVEILGAPDGEPQQVTKICNQCNEERAKDQFPEKQWKLEVEEHPLCRLCYEYSKSDEQTRLCRECKLVLPQTQFDIHQWRKGADALCHGCRDQLGEKILGSLGTAQTKELSDGIMLCEPHSLERCDACMVDFTLPNQFARKRTSLGRDLTNDETEDISRAFMEDMNISKKICIMDGQPVCPRSGRKLRCPCNEVTYCSKGCQVHHWTIHKMTCKVQLEKERKRAAKKADKEKKRAAQPPAHGLTEEQLNNIRIEAFFAENSGAEHSIEECAHQLGEHPLVIGGGSIQMGRNGQTFVKGDVAKIYLDSKGVVWDGSPRFGLGPYVQRKAQFDWIAKAREGKSQREIEIEKFLRGEG